MNPIIYISCNFKNSGYIMKEQSIEKALKLNGVFLNEIKYNNRKITL
jgi:hypothetical protein